MRRTPALLTAAAVVAAAALALTGCTPGAKGESTPSATARPTGTSTPMAVTTPAPACSALVDPSEVTALVGGTGEPQTFEHLQSGGVFNSASWAALTANGAVCGWGQNGLMELTGDFGSPSVSVQLAPGLENAWNELVERHKPSAGSAYDGAVSRGGACEGSFCSTDVLVEGAWLRVAARGAGTAVRESGFHDFVQQIVTRYRALPRPTVLSAHPRDCDDEALLSSVRASFGDGVQRGDKDDAFAFGIGLQRAGYATSCRFDDDGGGSRIQSEVTVLDHATPALIAAYRSGVDHPGAKDVDVSSLPGSASGLFEPTEDSERTIVDVLDEGRWVEVVTYETDDSAKTVDLAKALLASDWVRK
ncbi:hypothetical protein IT072_14965 [Leifsonia sp. ZF2019]|uniref:hypothetical protein n=1 Tax=Leifsonia sp. ZF2019 TaxID=2781978 RepID=UPI001CBCB3F3|nr:hypothetical protein [Leifsonia sp. ZF2019]UAJ78540.1 hypothetical protein IT072_14965 [Leifsonia sp. ZF2019]